MIHCWRNMEIDSPVEITEEEAKNTVKELWKKLFSLETTTDVDDFYTDRGMKRPTGEPGNGSYAKSSQNGNAGNSDPLPLGYCRWTCPKCVLVVLLVGHRNCKRDLMAPNWGLRLCMERVSSEEVHQIEDKIIEYMVMKTRPRAEQKELKCFVWEEYQGLFWDRWGNFTKWWEFKVCPGEREAFEHLCEKKAFSLDIWRTSTVCQKPHRWGQRCEKGVWKVRERGGKTLP